MDDRFLSRRRALGALAAGAALTGCAGRAPAKAAAASPTPVAPVDPAAVRIVSVPTAIDGGLLPTLLEEHATRSGAKVSLAASPHVYELARDGKADLVISHYGHKDAEAFVLGGFGRWPRTVFSNQLALVGPPSDPAGVRGLGDLVEAFKRIAARRSPFIVNGIDGVRYLCELLWNAAGRPEREGFWIDEHMRKGDAAEAAAAREGYTIWGLTPFTKLRNERAFALEPLVVGDPLLQRIMVSVVVRHDRVAAANEQAATAVEQFLLSPATQARIRETHYAGTSAALWAPAGRNNRAATLPKE